MRNPEAISTRLKVIREIVRKAVSHDFKSPIHHFQDLVQEIIDRETKDREGNLDPRWDILQRNVSEFDEYCDGLTEKFKKYSEAIKDSEQGIPGIKQVLKDRIEPIKIQIDTSMKRISSHIDALDVSKRGEFQDLSRFRTNVERFYDALEVMVSDDASKVSNQDDANLQTLYRRLLKAALRGDFSIETSGRTDGTDLKVTCVRAQIEACMQNVILNAARFASWSSEEKQIRYETFTQSFDNLRKRYPAEFSNYKGSGRWVEFHVMNTGARVPNGSEKEIFDFSRFLEEDRHVRYGGGGGYGLAIAKIMCIENRGKIFLNSENSNFTDFVICLPVKPKNGISRSQLFRSEYAESEL